MQTRNSIEAIIKLLRDTYKDVHITSVPSISYEVCNKERIITIAVVLLSTVR
jgi:hypothetical protein